MHYERKVNGAFRSLRLVALCTYCSDTCSASDVIDVCSHHEFALARRQGAWQLLESSSLKSAKEELVRLRTEVAKLRDERDRAQSVLNTSGSLMTAEKASHHGGSWASALNGATTSRPSASNTLQWPPSQVACRLPLANSHLPAGLFSIRWTRVRARRAQPSAAASPWRRRIPVSPLGTPRRSC